jgi:hypothetical protein
MALQRVKINGYGQLELNAVAFRRSGRIEAQCRIADGIDYIENGMLLAVNNIKRVVEKTAEGGVYPIALHYSTEHMYDERANALKDFRLDKETVLPRMGYLGAGDKYTTNCLAYDDAKYATETELKAAVAAVATTPLYAHVCENGAHLINEVADKAVAIVLGETTMPDGQYAVKFQAL